MAEGGSFEVKKYISLIIVLAVLALIVVGIVLIMQRAEPAPGATEPRQIATTGTAEGSDTTRVPTLDTEPSDASGGVPSDTAEDTHIAEEPIVGKEYHLDGFTIVRDDNGKDWITAYDGEKTILRVGEFGLLKPTGIGPGAFAGTNIEDAYFYAEITEIGERAFENCKNLKTLTINNFHPEALTRIGYRAFANTPELTELYISYDHTGTKNVVFIESETFEGSGIRKFVVSGSYQIKDRAFANCKNLSELWISAETMELADNMLEGSPNVIVYCPTYSKAIEWCREHKVTALDSGRTWGHK